MIILGYLIGYIFVITRHYNSHFVFIRRNAIGGRLCDNTSDTVITERFHFFDYVGCSGAGSDYFEAHWDGVRSSFA